MAPVITIKLRLERADPFPTGRLLATSSSAADAWRSRSRQNKVGIASVGEGAGFSLEGVLRAEGVAFLAQGAYELCFLSWSRGFGMVSPIAPCNLFCSGSGKRAESEAGGGGSRGFISAASPGRCLVRSLRFGLCVCMR